jgi:hypothetical protein
MSATKTIVKPSGANLKPKPRVSGFVPASPEAEEQIKSTLQPLPLQQQQKKHSNFPPPVHSAASSQPGPAPTVPLQNKQDQESTTAFVNDGRYVLLSDLPSRYLFYGFKELWIRPFTPNEARLIHMAKVSGNLTYIVSAVAACISKKITSLVIEDFEFCLYWLRLNSYPTKPFTVTWTCDQPLFEKDTDFDEIEEPKQVKICTQKNTTIVSSTNLKIESLDADFKLPANIAMPTMEVFEEIWECKNQLENLDEDEPNFIAQREELIGDLYLMNLAQWCKEGQSLKEKLEILKNSTDMGFQGNLESSIAEIPAFGVSEDLEVTCEACGGATRRRLSLDYLSFFP